MHFSPRIPFNRRTLRGGRVRGKGGVWQGSVFFLGEETCSPVALQSCKHEAKKRVRLGNPGAGCKMSSNQTESESFRFAWKFQAPWVLLHARGLLSDPHFWSTHHPKDHSSPSRPLSFSRSLWSFLGESPAPLALHGVGPNEWDACNKKQPWP